MRAELRPRSARKLARLPPLAPRDMLGTNGPTARALRADSRTRSTRTSAVRVRRRAAVARLREHRHGGARSTDALHDFERFVHWLEAARVLDAERTRRCGAARSSSRPARSPCSATRAACAPCCARSPSEGARERRIEALAEINRVLGRSAGTRRVELRSDGTLRSRLRSRRRRLRRPPHPRRRERGRRAHPRRARRACDAAPIRAARACSRTRRRTAAAAGATWPPAAIARRRRGTG